MFYKRIPAASAFDTAAAELQNLVNGCRQRFGLAQTLRVECMLMISLMCKSTKGKEIARVELAGLAAGKLVSESSVHPSLLKASRELLES